MDSTKKLHIALSTIITAFFLCVGFAYCTR